MADTGWIAETVDGLRPLTPENELAEVIGVSQRTLRRWRAEGRVVGIRTAAGGSGRVSYPREAVRRLLAEMASLATA